MKTKTYKIYFEQVNQIRIEVKAISESHAISKAMRQWRKENVVPRIIDIETEEK